MSARAWLLATGVPASAALVWVASGELELPARAWTAVLLTVLPALAVMQAGMLDQVTDVPRTSVYVSSTASLWLLAAITILVMWLSRGVATWPGLRGLGLTEFLLWTAGTTCGALLVTAGLHRLGMRQAPLLRYLLPVSAREKQMFVALSITAGVCEELVFRAFLIATLLTATGSLALALLLSSGVFGVLHAYQRPAGAVRAGLLGATLALPLLATGSVLPSMAAHAVFDIVAGLWLRELLLR